ncbi:DUF4192 family protein [Microbacterium sp. YY-01]|uniref:DUF4192 family protein n=1 Tax=Microbacterium sp. YY-01 TaxID=3421634 RepID=UPI003D17FD5E
MTTILRASGAPQLLAAIPALAGYTPSNSVVLIPFDRGRSQGALRLDLPTYDDSGDYAEFAATAIGITCRLPTVDGVAIVVYTDHSVHSSMHPRALGGIIDAIGLRAEACDLHVIETIIVGCDGWLDHAEEKHEPLSLVQIPETPKVPGVGDVSGDQHSGLALPTPTAQQREEALYACNELDKVFQALRLLQENHVACEHSDACCTPHELLDTLNKTAEASGERIDPRALAMYQRLDDAPQFLEEILDSPAGMTAYEAAALSWCFSRPLVRDVALVQWARDRDHGDQALAAQLRFAETTVAVPEHIGGVLSGQGKAPDRDRMLLALSALRAAAALAPRAKTAGLLTGAAWISWAIGRATHAEHYVAQAHAIDPDHSLAGLIRTMISASLLPDWAFTAPRGAAAISPAETESSLGFPDQ